jgi:hypothetical protein
MTNTPNENKATTTPAPPKTAAKPQGERTPIAIHKLIITHSSPHGVHMPDGPHGEGQRQDQYVLAGTLNDRRTTIEHLPWMRVFRIARERRITRSGENGGKEIEIWEPMGRPFHIPDTWAVSIPAED